jgi:hypothetical protein
MYDVWGCKQDILYILATLFSIEKQDYYFFGTFNLEPLAFQNK